jgi:hypothetical protein
LAEYLAIPTQYPLGPLQPGMQSLGKDGGELYLFGKVSVIRDGQGQVAGVYRFNHLHIEYPKNFCAGGTGEMKSREAFQQLIGKSPELS